jgi:hypothetical protein
VNSEGEIATLEDCAFFPNLTVSSHTPVAGRVLKKSTGITLIRTDGGPFKNTLKGDEAADCTMRYPSKVTSTVLSPRIFEITDKLYTVSRDVTAAPVSLSSNDSV